MKDVVVGGFCPLRCFAALPRNLAPLWGWMGDLAVAAFSGGVFFGFFGVVLVGLCVLVLCCVVCSFSVVLCLLICLCVGVCMAWF